MIGLIERLSRRVFAWALYRQLRGKIARPDLRRLIHRELREVEATLISFVENLEGETDILTRRLGRRYDPGMALAEATQRALAAKGRDLKIHAVTGLPFDLTDRQQAALEHQTRRSRRLIVGSAALDAAPPSTGAPEEAALLRAVADVLIGYGVPKHHDYVVFTRQIADNIERRA